MRIPFVRALIDSNEIEAVSQVLSSGELGGNGETGKQVELALERLISVKHALLMTSCTSCLETAVRLMDLSYGDEVICPSFAFPSCANAILLCGAKVIFADICPDTLNIDVKDIARKISPKTKGIIVVHYAGVACDMDAIMALAAGSGLWVIEDAAQCIGSNYKGRALGSIGEIGCFSFHATKNIICGEGGCFVTNSDTLSAKAEIFREKGTNRTQFIQGKIDKYSWTGLGSSFVLSEIQAAILNQQLTKLEMINSSRAKIAAYYTEALVELEKSGLITLGRIPSYCKHNSHIFYFLLEKGNRDAFISELRALGIEATSHFYPLHISSMGKKLGYKHGDFPVTETIHEKVVRLPIYPQLGEKQLQYVSDSISGILQ
jgi:dTDP-4-amino-4,6-dideoxygalactose transaminase